MGQVGILEREAELAQLSAAIERASEGSGRTILIEGAAGIGKSALVAAVGELATEHGMRVLGAGGAELEREFSHGVVRQLFERTISATPEEERGQVFAGAAALARGLLEPGANTTTPAPDGAFAILHGLYWLTANLAETDPLLLAIDDVHWADRPSLRFLDYLCRRLDGTAILVVCAFRPAEPGAEPLPLGSLGLGAKAIRLAPRPLTEDAATVLLRDLIAADADQGFCSTCHEASGGNPLLLRELARTIADAGIPPTERQARAVLELGGSAAGRTVELRLGSVSPDVSRLAEAAAVLGDGAAVRDAAELAGLGEERGFEAVAVLYALDILRRGNRIEFVHPLVRAAIHDRIDPPERERAHARAARLLADAGASPERIAAHLLVAGPAGDPAAVATLREAARKAQAAGGPEDAASYLRRALAERPPDGERGDVLFELGTAELHAGALDGAVTHLRQALDLSRDPGERGATAHALVVALWLMERFPDAAHLLERELDSLGGAPAPIRAELEAALTSTLLFAVDVDRMTLDSVVDRVAAKPSTDTLTETILVAAAAYRLVHRGDVPVDRVVSLAERALRADLLRDVPPASAPVAALLHTLICTDEVDLAGEAIDEAIEVARRTGSPLALGQALNLRSILEYRRGALLDAEASAATGLEISREHESAIGTRSCAASVADAMVDRGRPDEAWAELERDGLTGELPAAFMAGMLAEGRGRVRAAQGENAGATADLLLAGDRFRSWGTTNPSVSSWRSAAALARLQQGERAEAQRLASEELELARRFGAPRAVGIALRTSGLVEGGDAGVALLSDAVTTLEGTPARLELAKALTDLGAALRRANRRRDARDPLRRGMELAHACGAEPLEEHARAELRASGARPRKLAVSGAASLTPSERRVAELAAEGLRNREIAQRLFVTEKTVEMHLTNSYRKLDLGSRAELAAALEESPQESPVFG